MVYSFFFIVPICIVYKFFITFIFNLKNQKSLNKIIIVNLIIPFSNLDLLILNKFISYFSRFTF